jgi:HEAT repeat protein
MVACLMLAVPLSVRSDTPVTGPTAAEDKADPDEILLRQAQIGTDAASLVRFFTSVSRVDVEPQRLEELIRQLGSRSFGQRDRAVNELIAVGRPALIPLRRALASRDPEVVRLAQTCIREIDRPEPREGVPAAAVRLLLRLRPPETVPALLRYLPYAAPEWVQEEIYYALNAFTVKQGKVDPALVAALTNVAPTRRAVAACIVGWRGDADQRAAVRKLLADPDPMVRLRAAQGLLAAGDKAAVPILITLLNEPSAEVSWQAEELLHWIAGEEAPDDIVGAASAHERQTCRSAWEGWWARRGRQLDFRVLEQAPRRPGLYLVCESFGDDDKREARVWLCGCDGKPRWQVRDLRCPIDAHLLPGNRILIVEYYPVSRGEPGIVGERDLTGKLLWHTEMHDVQSCERLANGNTFILSTHGVAEVTPKGHKVYDRSLSEPEKGKVGNRSCCSRRLRNGHVLCADPRSDGPEYLVEVDPVSGQDVRKIRLPPRLEQYADPVVTEVCGRNHYLFQQDYSLIREFEATGKVVWQYKVKGPAGFMRLRNGNTFGCAIVCNPTVNRFIEVNPAGQLVWEVLTPGGRPVGVCLGLVRLGFDQPRPAGFDLATSVTHRVHGLASRTAFIRQGSAALLGTLGCKAGPAVPALIEALDDREAAVRNEANEALKQILGPGTLPDLLRAAKDKRVNVRAAVPWLLWKFREQPKVVVPVLLEALHDDSALVRRQAACALRQYGTEKEVVPALIQALKDPELAKDRNQGSVASNAADSLGAMRVRAKAAIPGLVEALKAEDHCLRERAIWALGAIGGNDKTTIPAMLPGLVVVLKDRAQKDLHATAASALREMGAAARPAVPALEEALNVKDVADPWLRKFIRDNVKLALDRLKAPPRETEVAELVLVLQGVTRDVAERQAAAEVLGYIGPEAESAIPALTRALKDVDPRIRVAADRALKKVER